MPVFASQMTRFDTADAETSRDSTDAPPYSMAEPHPTSELEQLPLYRTALTKFGSLKCKREMATPFEKSRSRKWMPAHVTINGTQLQITTGKVLKHCQVFSLQCARVGLATDYDKSPYCLRLRIEAQQYIFSMQTLKELFEWMLALQMAIGLALPLDLRHMPEITRNRRQRRRRPEKSQLRSPARDSHRQQDDTNRQAHDRIQLHVETEHSDSRARQDGKWSPRIERQAPASKDFAKLHDDEPWTGQVHLHRGKWALVTESRMVYT